MWRWSLSFALASTNRNGVLHVCGDDPPRVNWAIPELLCSPRMWRWSSTIFLPFSPVIVFSTYVEMIPTHFFLLINHKCVLHVCGDDPNCGTIGRLEVLVFSTYVEMILTAQLIKKTGGCVLHVCGDDPLLCFMIFYINWCSPRMWRWSRATWVIP